MSGPTPTLSLPRDIFELLSTTVSWERFLGFDGHAEPSYAAPVVLTCWMEPHATAGTAGAEAYRRADGTVVEPVYDLYFDGDDINAQLIELYDRFLVSAVALDSAQKLQATRVETRLGPNFDNTNPWLICVTL